MTCPWSVSGRMMLLRVSSARGKRKIDRVRTSAYDAAGLADQEAPRSCVTSKPEVNCCNPFAGLKWQV